MLPLRINAFLKTNRVTFAPLKLEQKWYFHFVILQTSIMCWTLSACCYSEMCPLIHRSSTLVHESLHRSEHKRVPEVFGDMLLLFLRYMNAENTHLMNYEQDLPAFTSRFHSINKPTLRIVTFKKIEKKNAPKLLKCGEVVSVNPELIAPAGTREHFSAFIVF